MPVRVEVSVQKSDLPDRFIARWQSTGGSECLHVDGLAARAGESGRRTTHGGIHAAARAGAR